MCCLTEMETVTPNPYASLTIINQVWPCPVLTLYAVCVEGDRVMQPDPHKILVEVFI